MYECYATQILEEKQRKKKEKKKKKNGHKEQSDKAQGP